MNYNNNNNNNNNNVTASFSANAVLHPILYQFLNCLGKMSTRIKTFTKSLENNNNNSKTLYSVL